MAYDSREAVSGAMTLDDIKDVPILPSGHYHGKILRFEPRDDVGDNKRSVVDFYVRVTHAASDIDSSKLEGIDLSEMEFQRTYWYTTRGMPQLRDFLASFKFPRGIPVDALYPETVGREVLCTISVGTYKNKRTGKDTPTNNLDDMVAVVEEVSKLTDL